ncbi:MULTISPECIES: hypothetical protein [Amycolatopsis]|uniref:Uncharacterized protein n=1 Tax=Amycolatopsis bullii TaxID=941987 RepID=A0ABQ3KS19_9PSEU|nr:hypothetical protein [Amycolatopsis bullii]GHG42806.1 hypothetical protein GCM10017567_75950 [Amycolatopsis bullii]
MDHARAALEIVDSRVSDWGITITDTVADNAFSGLFVLADRELTLAVRGARRRHADVPERPPGLRRHRHGLPRRPAGRPRVAGPARPSGSGDPWKPASGVVDIGRGGEQLFRLFEGGVEDGFAHSPTRPSRRRMPECAQLPPWCGREPGWLDARV